MRLSDKIASVSSEDKSPSGDERQTIIIKHSAGVRTDSNVEELPISDANNCEMMPDGQSMMNRRGYAIHAKYNPILPADSYGRQCILIDKSVPNLGDGTELLMVQHPTKGIVGMEAFKPRTKVPGDLVQAEIRFERESYSLYAGDSVAVKVLREGDVSKTVTVILTEVGGSSTTIVFAPNVKSYTYTYSPAESVYTTKILQLSEPTGGARITGSNPVQVVVMQAYIKLGYVATNEYPRKAVRLVMWDKVSNTVTAHYLNGYANQAVLSEVTDVVVPLRVGPNHIMVRVYDTNTDKSYASLYLISQLITDGGAYSASAAGYADAIKTLPYATVELPGAMIGEQSQFKVIRYTEQFCYLLSGSNIYELDLAGSVRKMPMPSHPEISGPYTPTGFCVGSDISGDIIIAMSAVRAAVTYYFIMAINPIAGKLTKYSPLYEYGVLGNFIAMGHLSDGGVVYYDADNTRLVRFARDLKSFQVLGTITLIENYGFAPTEADTILVIDYGATDKNHYKKLTIGATTFTENYDYGAIGDADPEDDPDGIPSWITAGTFSQYCLASPPTITIYDALTGATVSTANVADQYGAETKDTEFLWAYLCYPGSDELYRHPRLVGNRRRRV